MSPNDGKKRDKIRREIQILRDIDGPLNTSQPLRPPPPPIESEKSEEGGESCIMSKWIRATYSKNIQQMKKAVYRKEPPCRFLSNLVLLAAEVEESRDN